MSEINRRDVLKYLGIGGIAAGAAAMGAQLTPQKPQSHTEADEAVLQKGVLRCGYMVGPPWFDKDHRNQPTGVYHDIMTALAHSLSVKVEWVAEIPLADFPAALATGKIDVYATPVAPTAQRARGADFLNPITLVPFAIGARKGKSFSGNWRDLDQKNITISSIEGAMNDVLGKKFFPNTRALTLPQLSPFSDIFVNVATHKADIVIQDSVSIHNFMRANPGKLEIIPDMPPVVVLPWTMAIRKNEFALKQLLNTALDDLHTMGEIHVIHQKYGVYKDGVFAPAANFGTTIAMERASQ